jgi:hypothetical protein
MLLYSDVRGISCNKHVYWILSCILFFLVIFSLPLESKKDPIVHETVRFYSDLSNYPDLQSQLNAKFCEAAVVNS